MEITDGDLALFLRLAEEEVARWPEWKKRALANFGPGSAVYDPYEVNGE